MIAIALILAACSQRILQQRRLEGCSGKVVASRKQIPMRTSAINNEVLIPEVAASRLIDRSKG